MSSERTAAARAMGRVVPIRNDEFTPDPRPTNPARPYVVQSTQAIGHQPRLGRRVTELLPATWAKLDRAIDMSLNSLSARYQLDAESLDQRARMRLDSRRQRRMGRIVIREAA